MLDPNSVDMLLGLKWRMPRLDQAHLACASSQGQIWVYNWREDRVVSQLRNTSVILADEDGNPEAGSCSHAMRAARAAWAGVQSAADTATH